MQKILKKLPEKVASSIPIGGLPNTASIGKKKGGVPDDSTAAPVQGGGGAAAGRKVVVFLSSCDGVEV